VKGGGQSFALRLWHRIGIRAMVRSALEVIATAEFGMCPVPMVAMQRVVSASVAPSSSPKTKDVIGGGVL